MFVRSGPPSRVAERRTALRYPCGSLSCSPGKTTLVVCKDATVIAAISAAGHLRPGRMVPPLGVSVEMNVFLPRPDIPAGPRKFMPLAGSSVQNREQRPLEAADLRP